MNWLAVTRNNRRQLGEKKKMKAFTKNAAVALILLATLAFTVISLHPASGHTPAWRIPSYAYIVAAPNPVGINQTVTIAMWVDHPLPAAALGNDVRRHNYKLTITKPDGTTETNEWVIIDDTTGVQSKRYTPDQIGIYSLEFSYPEQVYTWNATNAMKTWTNDVFLAATATTTFTAQQEQIPWPPSYELPTDYWTRPIEGQNEQWYRVASNWLGAPQIQNEPNGRYQMDGAAPGSAHIMWTKPLQMGGVVGGTNVGIEGETFYDGETYDVRNENPLIMYGRLYYEEPFGTSDSGGGYACVDLRTGEQIWWREIPAQTFGQIMDYQHPNQHGAIANGFLWVTAGRGDNPRNWTATDPWTGRSLFNLTGVPPGTSVYGPNGEILIYQLDSAKKWLACWNSTVALGSGSPGRGSYADIDGSTAYSWNITLSNLPSGTWSIKNVFYDDLVLCSQGNFGERGNWQGANMTAISIQESAKGALLWTNHYPAPEGNVTRMLTSVDSKSRVFVFRDQESLSLSAYSLDNGKKLWGPIKQSTSSWEYFSSSLYTYAAYGKLYSAGMDGVLECFDIKNGTLLWTYGNGGIGNNTNSGLATVYGNYPIYVGAIADEKLYLFTSEHTPNTPLFKGARVRCIDANTGKELWTVMSWLTTGGGGQRGAIFPSIAIADGYLIYLNGYDMQFYCIGKGPSATTVAAPTTAVNVGQKFSITGTVTDQSTGAKGTPAISDDSMSEWMEYLYMQKPMPTDAKGVIIKLSAIDPNNNFINIGETTSDIRGNFGYTWTPEVPGLYQIIATFEGSESYWPSYATTYLTSVEAPVATTTPAPAPSAPDYTILLYGILGAVIAAMIIGLIALFRKQ